MKCIEIQSKISDWVDGGPAEGELESHLKVCRACASFHEDVLALKQSSGALGLVDPPRSSLGEPSGAARFRGLDQDPRGKAELLAEMVSHGVDA